LLVSHPQRETEVAGLREALDAMPHKVWMVRMDGPPIYYNHSMRDFARAALELPDRASRERALFHPDDLARFVASRTQALAAERDWAIEARMRAPDQSYRWHRLNFSVLRRWGKADAWLVTATDIDDLQRALIAAQEGEEQLRLAADAAQLGIYVYDLVTGEHSWSLELKRIFGIPPDSPAPRSIADLIHPDDRARFEAVRAASLDPAGEGTFQDEHRIVRSDGFERWVFVKGRVSFDSDGTSWRPRRGLGLVLDITERKRAETALVESEARYRMLFETANDIVATLALDGRIISINPAARDILGFEPEELIGKTIYEFVPREQMAMQQAVLQRKVEGQPSTQYDLEVVTKSGQRRILGINSRLVFDAAGKPECIHSIARDITERKEAEARQTLLMRELQHRTKNLLAVIQAIACNTLKGNPGVDAFIGRLHALAHAQEFVTAGPRGGVPLRQLLETELAAFGKRARLTGEDLVLDGGFAQKFTLLIHELATNAIKHGAFSSPKGHVAIEWQTMTEEGLSVLRLFWTERGGPPAREPTVVGFGTRLISTVGRSRVRFTELGLEFDVSAPMSEAKRAEDEPAGT
jgi:PAS domain S-box-containing protein